MRPWDAKTTSEAIPTHLSTREAIPRPWDNPMVDTADTVRSLEPVSEVSTSTQESPKANASARLQSTTCGILRSLEDALEETAAVAAEPPDYFEAANKVLDFRPNMPRKKKMKILILCGGPNDRDVSLYNLFISAGFECVNYDRLNGQQFDLVDDVVKDEILRDIAAGEYVAAFASPECSTFSKLHNLPGPHLSGRWRDPKDTASRLIT